MKSIMSKSLFACLVLAVSLFSPRTVKSQQVQKIKMKTLMAYAESADHPVIVNVWATWCAPCIEELPWFDKALKEQKDTTIELILVSLDFADRYEKAIATFLQKNPIRATLYWLDETDADYFCPLLDSNWSGNIPVSLFLNNKTRYRKFFDDQVKATELKPALLEMLHEE